MDILDDMGVSKLSAKVFWKVDYFFKCSSISLMAFLQSQYASLYKKKV